MLDPPHAHHSAGRAPAHPSGSQLARLRVRLDLALDFDAPRTERPNGAQRQIAAREAGTDLRDLYASTVQETAETYGMAAEVRQ